MTEAGWDATNLVRMGLVLGYGLTIAIVFVHASYNEQNVLAWTAVACIPGFGFIAYFLFYYVHGIGATARRAKRRAERQWEFELTDKGKKKDPNAPPEEPREKIVTESPLSKDSLE